MDAGERLVRGSTFMELQDRDLQLVRQTAAMVRQHAGTIVDDLYERLAAFPEAAALLARASDATGEDIDRRREALKAWLRNVLTLVDQDSDWLPQALRSTGALHAGASKSSVRVPLDLMVMTMASLQNSINSLLIEVGHASAEAVAAWGKLLWLIFDVMASAYDDELPAGTNRT